MPRQTIMLTPQSCDLFQRPFFQFAQIRQYQPETEAQTKQGRPQSRVASVAHVGFTGSLTTGRGLCPAAYRTLVQRLAARPG